MERNHKTSRAKLSSSGLTGGSDSRFRGNDTPFLHESCHNFFRDRRVVVTGGLGFIGSNLAHRLIDLGSQVTLLDALIPGLGGNRFNIAEIETQVRVVITDLRTCQDLKEILTGAEVLFNLAGTLSHIDSMEDPVSDLSLNCQGHLLLLEAIRRFCPEAKVIFTGTRSQYGRARSLPVDESHPQLPADINGIHNMAAEAYHLLYGRIYGLKSCSLRLTNTYGPRHQMRHPRQGVINWFIRQLIDGEEVRLYGNGSQVRDVTYVEDVVEALLAAASSDATAGEVYNLGGDALSLSEMVEAMIRVHGSGCYRLIPYPEEVRGLEVGDYKADYTKLTRAVGWKPRVSLEEGLKRTFQFYKRFGSQYWSQR